MLDLPVYFTCDINGRLKPCGCFTGQYGGMTRLKTYLDAQGSAASLRVDVGDAIAGREDFDVVAYRYVLQAFADLDYDAVNVGHREARLSAAELREIRQSSPVPILSANLLDQSTREPLFEPYRIVEEGGFRIAIVGVVDPRGLEAELGEGLEVAEMATPLTRLLPDLRRQADLVVLLAFTDEQNLALLAQEFYEVRVILGGRVSQPAQDLQMQNRSLISFVTNESRAVGRLTLRLMSGAAPEAIHHEVVLLHDLIPEDPAFSRLASAYRDEIRRMPLAVDDPDRAGRDMVPGVRTAAHYVGTDQCLECHETAAAIWKESGHSHAFETLVERGADADPQCVGCHTVGFGRISGYLRAFGGERLVDVGCESCHGPGSLHVQRQQGDGGVDFTFRPLAAGDCQSCHYGEFSRPFDWDEFWPLIEHGREPDAEDAPIAAADNPGTQR